MPHSYLYFSGETILKNFKSLRLGGEQRSGKTNLERTTAMGAFLSLDMTQKIIGDSVVDLNPELSSAESATPRQTLTEKYTDLFMPALEENNLVVREFGYTQVDGDNGRGFLNKAFSSNFLTQPLKKASVAAIPRPYPGRPVPLMILGVGSEKWGVEKHPDWKSNLLVFMENRECDKDFFPLIVYLLRYRNVGVHDSGDFSSGLRFALEEFLTEELSEYLVTNSTADQHDWKEPGLFTADTPHVDFRSLADNSETTGVPDVINDTDVEWPDPDDVVGNPPFNVDVIRRALAALQSESHLILIGPPGTGKTTLAKRIAERCRGNAYQLYTATSDWTTHEVLGGYMPDPMRPERLTFSPGIITRALSENEWLIVDEINRADVDKAFGELFTFLAGRDVVLTHSYQRYNDAGDPVGQPKRIVLKAESSTNYNEEEYVIVEKKADWRVIGTMNTFDKAALYQLSYAFMRRFAFVEVPAPSPPECKEIITRATALPTMENASESTDNNLWVQITELLLRVFADETTGLHATGKPVGASIPLDTIKYLKTRVRSETSETSSARLLTLEALEMFLFPQFEAQRRNHKVLLEKIRDALKIDQPLEKDKLDKSLCSWTGAVPAAETR